MLVLTQRTSLQENRNCPYVPCNVCRDSRAANHLFKKLFQSVVSDTLIQAVSIVNMTQSEDKQDTMHFLYLSEELWKIGHCLPTCAL